MKKIGFLTLAVIFLAGTAAISQPDPHQSKFYGQKMANNQKPTRPKFADPKKHGNGKHNPWDKYKKRRK